MKTDPELMELNVQFSLYQFLEISQTNGVLPVLAPVKNYDRFHPRKQTK